MSCLRYIVVALLSVVLSSSSRVARSIPGHHSLRRLLDRYVERANAVVVQRRPQRNHGGLYNPATAGVYIWGLCAPRAAWMVAQAGPCHGHRRRTLALHPQALLSSILATPLSFTEENLFPFTLPAVNQALTGAYSMYDAGTICESERETSVGAVPVASASERGCDRRPLHTPRFAVNHTYPQQLDTESQPLLSLPAVGQILLCVFGLIITNFIMGPLKAHPVTKTATSPLQLALRRFGLVLLFSCMVGIAYSTILTGLARTHNLTKLSQHFPSPVITHGATYFANGDFDGNVWASVWATQWLESIIFALYLMTAAVAAGGPEIAGALLGPMIIFNSISLSVDVSDPGFKFFWYAPMWHSSELVRNICFGTLSSRVGMHVGVHFAWAVLEVVLFFVVSIRKGLPVASIAASAPGVAEASKSAADTGTSIIVSVENAAVSTLTAVEAGMVTEAEVTAGTLLHKEGSTPVVMHGEPA